MSGDRLTPTELTRYVAWLERLARSIESDVDRADDLVQEVMVAALRNPPGTDRSPVPWLARVLRRSRALRRRRDARRDAREVVAARRGASFSIDAVEDEVATRELVTLALAALREPYRSTLVLRHLRGLSPAEIADAHAVPVRTVHTRITRGLRLLRAEAEALRRPRSRRPLLGWWCWRRPAAVGLAASLGVAVVATWQSARDVDRGPLAVVDAGEDAANDRRRPRIAASVDRRAAPLSRPVAASHRDRPVFSGRVVDTAGRSVPDAELRLEWGDVGIVPGEAATFTVVGESIATERSGGDGRFVVARPARMPPGAGARIVASAPGTVTVMAAIAVPGLAHDLAVVVAPRIPIDGVVVDARGDPVAGARVELRPSSSLSTVRAPVEESLLPVSSITTSDVDGRFLLEDGFDVDTARLIVSRDGFRERSMLVDGVAFRCLRLEDASPAATTVRGRVLDPDRDPVEGALVVAGPRWCRTGADGSFEVERVEDATDFPVVAAARGFLPTRATVDVSRESELILGGCPLRIRGRVVDADGAPVRGAVVTLLDPTPLMRDEHTWFVESVIESRGFHGTATTFADERGEFELSGLDRRPYRVGVVGRGLVLTAIDVDPSLDPRVEVRVPSDRVLRGLRGGVVDRAGKPIPGATVLLRRLVMDIPFPSGEPVRSFLAGGSVACDGDGRFMIDVVADEGCELQVSAPGWLTAEFAVDAVARGRRLTLLRSAALRVDAARMVPTPTAMRVLDAAGRPLRMQSAHGSSRAMSHGRRSIEIELEEGRSPPVFVSEAAAQVVCYREGRVVGRGTLRLSMNRVNDLELR